MSEEQDNPEVKVNTIDGLDDASSAGAPPDTATPEARLAEAEKAVAAKTEECKILSDKYLRLVAEFENYKRLAQREQRDQIKFGNEQLLKELLPVLDNMERAIKAAHDNNNNAGSSALIQGVDLTLKQLSGILAKFGIQAIETVGQAFNPAAHQAVSHMPSDTVPRDHVIDEFQKGYRLHDRILRAAMVSVSAGRAQTNEDDSTSN
jgi:molecular chaperone GrpE